MPPSKVPFDLLNPHTATTTTTLAAETVVLCIGAGLLPQLDENTVTAVQRFVAAPAPLNAVLDALLGGPSRP